MANKKFKNNSKRLEIIDKEYNKYFNQYVGAGNYMTQEPRIDYNTFYLNPEVRLNYTGVQPHSSISGLTNIDSELQGLYHPTSRDCPGSLYVPQLNQKPVKQNFNNFNESDQFLIQQSTRLMNPACLDRGRGINRFEFTPYEEQMHAFNVVPFERLCWTRLNARDFKEKQNEEKLYKCNPYCRHPTC